MAKYQGSVTVTGFIAPTDTNDTYATHDSVLGRGGLREVDDLLARNAIPADRRRLGMIVYVLENGHYYSLVGDITDLGWTDLGTTLGGVDDLKEQLSDLQVEVTELTERVEALEATLPTYEIAISIASTLELGELLFVNVLPYDLSPPTAEQGMASTLKPADTDLVVKLNGTIIGLISFTVAAQNGRVFFQQDAVLNKGDILTITAPETATALADVGVHLTFNIRELN